MESEMETPRFLEEVIESYIASRRLKKDIPLANLVAQLQKRKKSI